MILIIGSDSAGKRTYAKTLGYTENDMADGVMDSKPVIYHLEEMVYHNPDSALELVSKLLEKEVVICSEVGSGIIPCSAEDQYKRRMVGKLCINLAANAQKVVRVQAGIPIVIKE